MTNNKYIFTLHPISGCPVPDYYNPSFDSWYADSMKILASRSESEIAKILLDIDTYTASKILTRYGDTSELNQALENLSHQNIDTLYEWDLYPGRYQIISLLHLKADGKEPNSISSAPELKWVECFACLLLGKVAFAFDRENKLKETNFSSSPYGDAYYDLGEYIGMFALDCMEIHTLLRSQPGQDQAWDSQIKAMHAERSRKANNGKYANNREAKKIFFAWYDENRYKFQNNREAIGEYLSTVISDEHRDLVGTYRTLEDALRKRKNQNDDN